MAPVEVEREPRTLPIALAGLQVAVAVYASYTVARSLYQSHKALGPAQDTWNRKPERIKLTTAFGSLAALGLAFAVASGLEYLTLSYKVWACERDVPVPESTRHQFRHKRRGMSSMYPSKCIANLARIAQIIHRMLPNKPQNWSPRLSLLLLPLVANYALAFWLPNTTWTSSFPTLVALSKILTLAPLILPAIAPTSWGIVHSDPHDAHPDITKLFNTISAGTIILYTTTTIRALVDNLPDSSKPCHTLLNVPLDTEKRSHWERTATAVERILGSITDHPAVTAAGKDVLLCALSLGLWAAVRSTDVNNMLRSLSPIREFPRCFLSEVSPSKPTKPEPTPGPEDAAHPTPAPSFGMTLRRPRRSARGSISSTGSSNSPGEDTTTTTAAVHEPPKRRGRPRTAKPEPEPELKLKPKQQQHHRQPKQEDALAHDDKTYVPTPAVQAEAGRGLGDVVTEDDFDWESAALAWGVTVLGGLGLGGAAVWGAECLAR
ncbi:hypothetical protein CHGG_02980 [Chaetomium globosum CBS 148.51]|uniref:Uncharacterized protein n=1 Tax=Chaetomium globosum (strain ATCC 6205 / CBS 148.51 / DSM 1962 / NBRC 6347 / NRRL 1970) TaxID=306901 RepID=Q2H9X4_CHAGB|nr:uncharacterized protein CHGG_02980 [Chaetomium globosum CBS 148.51]EAQ91045.1 hypothetical protein CHGG_02980 [Chaetomium globosum CBS 148.51]